MDGLFSRGDEDAALTAGGDAAGGFLIALDVMDIVKGGMKPAFSWYLRPITRKDY